MSNRYGIALDLHSAQSLRANAIRQYWHFCATGAAVNDELCYGNRSSGRRLELFPREPHCGVAKQCQDRKSIRPTVIKLNELIGMS